MKKTDFSKDREREQTLRALVIEILGDYPPARNDDFILSWIVWSRTTPDLMDLSIEGFRDRFITGRLTLPASITRVRADIQNKTNPELRGERYAWRGSREDFYTQYFADPDRAIDLPPLDEWRANDPLGIIYNHIQEDVEVEKWSRGLERSRERIEEFNKKSPEEKRREVLGLYSQLETETLKRLEISKRKEIEEETDDENIYLILDKYRQKRAKIKLARDLVETVQDVINAFSRIEDPRLDELIPYPGFDPRENLLQESGSGPVNDLVLQEEIKDLRPGGVTTGSLQAIPDLPPPPPSRPASAPDKISRIIETIYAAPVPEISERQKQFINLDKLLTLGEYAEQYARIEVPLALGDPLRGFARRISIAARFKVSHKLNGSRNPTPTFKKTVWYLVFNVYKSLI